MDAATLLACTKTKPQRYLNTVLDKQLLKQAELCNLLALDILGGGYEKHDVTD